MYDENSIIICRAGALFVLLIQFALYAAAVTPTAVCNVLVVKITSKKKTNSTLLDATIAQLSCYIRWSLWMKSIKLKTLSRILHFINKLLALFTCWHGHETLTHYSLHFIHAIFVFKKVISRYCWCCCLVLFVLFFFLKQKYNNNICTENEMYHMNQQKIFFLRLILAI